MICKLTVRSGPCRGIGCVVTTEQSIRFGRQDSNDCVLDKDSAISRQHFEVFIKNNICWIRDLGSRNGTYVNDCPIESSQLNSGDEILAGNTRLFVKLLVESVEASDEDGDSHDSGFSITNQSAIETLLTSSKKIPKVDLTEEFFHSADFAQLLNELPGLAIVIHRSSKLAKDRRYAPIKLDEGMVLLTRLDDLPVTQLIKEMAAGTRLFVISHNLTRTNLQERLENSGRFFIDPLTFWDMMSRLPFEVLNSFLESVNVVICRQDDAAYGGMYISEDFDPQFRVEVESATLESG